MLQHIPSYAAQAFSKASGVDRDKLTINFARLYFSAVEVIKAQSHLDMWKVPEENPSIYTFRPHILYQMSRYYREHDTYDIIRKVPTKQSRRKWRVRHNTYHAGLCSHFTVRSRYVIEEICAMALRQSGISVYWFSNQHWRLHRVLKRVTYPFWTL